MRIVALLFTIAALIFSVGCGMSGPGIARVQGAPPQGYVEPARIDGVHPTKAGSTRTRSTTPRSSLI
jgi:hypothetical protein